MFLQDHRENGQLQPDHPGDSPSLGPPGRIKSLHGQRAKPLQLHQRGCHSAGEECPAAADAAAGLPWSADHNDTLYKLVRVWIVSFKTHTSKCIPHRCHTARGNPHESCMQTAEQVAHTRTSSWFLCLCHFLSLSLSFFLLHTHISCVKAGYKFLVFYSPQVPGESLASGQQLPHHSLSRDALLCKPDDRKRPKFQSRGVFRCVRSAPELNLSHFTCSVSEYVSKNLKEHFSQLSQGCCFLHISPKKGEKDCKA